MMAVNANRTRDTITFSAATSSPRLAARRKTASAKQLADAFFHRGCSSASGSQSPRRVRAEWWARFVKAWRKIGNVYQHRTRPPADLLGCEAFVVPDHAPLVPLVPRSDHEHALRLDTIDRSCGRKARYSTEDFANTVGIQCWQERNIWLRPYSCTFCGWHLTRSNAPPRMKPGWRLPKISERQQNTMRNARQRPNRRRHP
jgi:hypothetical protein